MTAIASSGLAASVIIVTRKRVVIMERSFVTMVPRNVPGY
jgi:hypothetical protein